MGKSLVSCFFLRHREGQEGAEGTGRTGMGERNGKGWSGRKEFSTVTISSRHLGRRLRCHVLTRVVNIKIIF